MPTSEISCNFNSKRGLDLLPIEAAQARVVDAVLEAANRLYSLDFSGIRTTLLKAVTQPKVAEFGDVAVPSFLIAKQVKKKPNEVAQEVGAQLQDDLLNSSLSGIIDRVTVEAMYINMRYSIEFLAEVVPSIVDRGFLNRLDSAAGDCEKKEKVMIEYSQPNTHKAFHVGHMRNAALGDSLVRIFEHVGHEVVAVNYFGDEGAHVSKCIWLLDKTLKEKNISLNELPMGDQPAGEYLGMFYSKAVEQLDLSNLTKYPFPGVIAAKVFEIRPHTAPEAPANWSIVKIQFSQEDNDSKEVVCGGMMFKEGDYVAYLPVGQSFQKKLIEPKDMMGVMSHGMIMAYDELGVEPSKDLVAAASEMISKKVDVGASLDKQNANSKKKGKSKKEKFVSKIIFVVECDESQIGKELVEIGRFSEADIPEGKSVMETFSSRKNEVSQILHALEHRISPYAELWDETKQWSLAEFKRIYSWLDCRFDYDFFESQVGEESRKMCLDYFEKGVLTKSDGAIGADLSKFNLPYCILIKSDGSGLYATKDLSLAHRKFTEFQIEKSIYVVDAAQTLHFQQVFATLQLMGYKNATKCFHLPYGQVRLPDGKMSSRKGTVIYFSDLQRTLGDQIYNDFLSKLEGDWSAEEIESARHALSVATIKYGMLNVDPAKDIVFEMSRWAAKSGDTGVYLMYGYARTQSILDKVPYPDGGKWNPALLVENPWERLLFLKMLGFWETVLAAASSYRPSLICSYLYDLTKLFMSWYDVAPVKGAENTDLQFSRLKLVQSVGEVLRVGTSILGIKTIRRM